MEHKRKTIGYLRVSTCDQDVEKNKAEILNLANEKNLGQVNFISEKVSGKIPWNERKLGKIFEQLNKGDNLIVNEMPRLGRSMLECMEIISLIIKKNVHLFSVKGNWNFDGSLQSKILAMVFALCAEIERDLISLRTREALAARKAKGLPMGRPKGPGKSKLDRFNEEIKAMLNNGTSQVFIAKRYGVTPNTVNNWIKKHKVIIPRK